MDLDTILWREECLGFTAVAYGTVIRPFWEKLCLATSFISLATGGTRTFYYHQLSFRIAVESFFQCHINEIHSKLKRKTSKFVCI